MVQRDGRVFTLTLSGRHHAVFWADERGICILAEQQIRDAIESGVDVLIEVDGPCQDDAERVRDYLRGVVNEARAVISTHV
jgi:hypothetical protein